MQMFEHPKVVSQAEWLAARKELLVKEKAFTRQWDAFNAERRTLPWVKVEKEYVFDTVQGKKTLAELFDGRSQLLLYHFMLGVGATEGCPGCSFFADHVDGPNLHLSHHDVTLMAVSHGELGEIERYKSRMGWQFPWASSFGSDFNFDFHVSFSKEELAKGELGYNYEVMKEARYVNDELPGLSVFYKDEDGSVFHTYSTYARGLDMLLGTQHFLDIAPKGRNERGPDGKVTMWVKRHDEYGEGMKKDCCSAE